MTEPNRPPTVLTPVANKLELRESSTVMAETPSKKSSGFSIDWLVKGSLTKIGDIFDRLTGRGWKPSSTLATSELIERMKLLMDAEVRKNGDGRNYVPHNIKLKMQWDKFSTDSEKALKKLENEFLIAAVDHINDKHYYTHAPLAIQIKPDYFTSGVKLYLGFEKLDGDEDDAEHTVTLDGLKTADLIIPDAAPEKLSGRLEISFQTGDKPVNREIILEEGRRLSVGRTKENDIAIDDQSVSKAHASLLLNKDGKLVVADTGSTNGTFVRGDRIAYGKAIEIATGDALLFGLIRVQFKFDLNNPPAEPETLAKTEAYKVGEFEFKSKSEQPGRNASVNERGDHPDRTRTPSSAATELKESNSTLASGGKPPFRTETGKDDRAMDVAPQPAPTEASIQIEEEKQDWEV